MIKIALKYGLFRTTGGWYVHITGPGGGLYRTTSIDTATPFACCAIEEKFEKATNEN